MKVQIKPLIFLVVLCLFLGGFSVFLLTQYFEEESFVPVKQIAEKPVHILENEDYIGDRSNFLFSPNKRSIALAEYVFEEYGNNRDRYWAVNIFDVASGTEKTIFVDDSRMSYIEWINNDTVRVYHNAGTGVRVYVDVPISRTTSLFSDGHGTELWTIDYEYVQRVKDAEEAYRVYNGIH